MIGFNTDTPMKNATLLTGSRAAPNIGSCTTFESYISLLNLPPRSVIHPLISMCITGIKEMCHMWCSTHHRDTGANLSSEVLVPVQTPSPACNTRLVVMDISVYLRKQLSSLANPSAWFKCQYLLHMCTSISLRWATEKSRGSKGWMDLDGSCCGGDGDWTAAVTEKSLDFNTRRPGEMPSGGSRVPMD